MENIRDLIIYGGGFIAGAFILVFGFGGFFIGLSFITSGNLIGLAVWLGAAIITTPFLIAYDYCANKQAEDLWGLNR